MRCPTCKNENVESATTVLPWASTASRSTSRFPVSAAQSAARRSWQVRIPTFQAATAAVGGDDGQRQQRQ